jgi:RimJ/RimL family protein N-acetyltransferase
VGTDDAPLFSTERLEARILSPGDEEPLQRVFEAAGDYFLGITGEPAPAPDAAEREIRSCAGTPGREVALLRLHADGRPVGAVGWWQGNPEPEVALVGMLLVVREARGQGLAREALDGLAGSLATQGVRRLRTGAGAGDQRTQALLRALGFAPLDQRRHVELDRGRIMLALFERGTDSG